MLDGLRRVSTDPCPCKICGGPAPLFGVVDFHQSCEQVRGVQFRLSGLPIYYRRCGNCNFLFTDAFDDWTVEQFKTHIYNEEYKLVDPDYSDFRPRENARAVVLLWGPLRIATAVTYDPMVSQYAERPGGKFDLVTSFETLEHLPDPLAGIRSIVELAADPGLVLFSTLLQPADFDRQRLSWWYVGPRNGHVSLFSRQALKIAWERYGYRVASLGDNVHFAFRNLPIYLAHLQPSLIASTPQSCAA
jgi:SAM-dependent methyltransferase